MARPGARSTDDPTPDEGPTPRAPRPPGASTVEVYMDGGYRCLRFAGGGGLVQGRMHLTRPLDFGTRYHPAVCAATLAAPDRALCLGLGVGAVPRLLRAMRPGLAVDVVEIDPGVIAAARDHFGVVEGDGLTVMEADAADFVRRPPPGPPYDVIVLDCYDDRRLPADLTTAGFVSRLLTLAAPGGVVVANVLTRRPGAGPLSTQLARRLCGARIITVPGASNRVWFGGRSGLPDLAAMRRRAAQAERRVPLALRDALSRARALG